MLRDADIREPLFDFLEDVFGKIRIIEEKMMGKSRADAVMITEDNIVGLEIKSDADSYARLSRQVKDYDKFYDENIVVVGTSHVKGIESHVPDYWGIITVDETDGKPDFYFLRKPSENPKLKMEDKLRILWRPELAVIQDMNDMPKYREKSKLFVINEIVKRTELSRKKGHINKLDLNRQISKMLFDRDYNNISESLREYKKSELERKLGMKK